MKNTKFLFIAFSILLYSCNNDDSSQESDEQNLSKMYAEIVSASMVNTTTCTNTEEWSFAAIGGPANFIVYSKKINVPEFLEKVENYGKARIEYNNKWYNFPTCALVFFPSKIDCVNGKPTLIYNEPGESSISTTNIRNYMLYGNGDEKIPQQNVVINSNSDWTKLMQQMNTRNNVTDNFSETNINFNEYTVIAIFDKIYGSGGHSIDITNIIENQNNIIVTVDNLLTGDATSVMTQPFHIVKIPKATKTILFE